MLPQGDWTAGPGAAPRACQGRAVTALAFASAEGGVLSETPVFAFRKFTAAPPLGRDLESWQVRLDKRQAFGSGFWQSRSPPLSCLPPPQLLRLLPAQVLPPGERQELRLLQALHGPEAHAPLPGPHGLSVHLRRVAGGPPGQGQSGPTVWPEKGLSSPWTAASCLTLKIELKGTGHSVVTCGAGEGWGDGCPAPLPFSFHSVSPSLINLVGSRVLSLVTMGCQAGGTAPGVSSGRSSPQVLLHLLFKELAGIASGLCSHLLQGLPATSWDLSSSSPVPPPVRHEPVG